jgi:hypothetical protein
MDKSGPSRQRDSGTIIRVDKAAGRWEAVPLSLLQDTRLSFDTRGFAAWLLARPPGWEIRAGALPYLLKDNSPRGHVGRDKARRFLRELEQAGYLRRSRTRGPEGCWIWDSVFTAVPTIDGSAVDGSSGHSSSGDGRGVDKDHTPTNTHGLTSDSISLQAGARPPVGAKTVVGPGKEIRFPEVLSGEHLASARKLIDTCPPEQRQAVLDEVAAMHQRGVLRKSPIGLLHRLVEGAKAGTFVPSYANSNRQKQHREVRERELAPERRSSGPATGPVSVGTIAQDAVARLRAMLKDGGE